MFNQTIYHSPANIFLRQLSLAPRRVEWTTSFVVVFGQMLPAILYALFLLTVAILQHQGYAFFSLLAELIVLLTSSAYILHGQWHQVKEHTVTGLSSGSNYTVIVLRWLLRSTPGLIITTKVFNVLFLFGLCKLHQSEDYDVRFLGMGVTIAAAMNAFILHQLIRFEHHEFKLNRMLPIPMSRRIMQTLMIIIISLLPEIVTLRWHLPSSRTGWEQVELVLLLAAIGFAAYTFLLRKALSPDQFARSLFAAAFSLVIAILFHAPLAILLAGVVGYCFLFPKRFYRYEYLLQRS